MTAGVSGTEVTASIVVTGDEVLAGRVRDANGPFLSADLGARGVSVTRLTGVGDRWDHLVGVLGEQLAQGPSLLVVTGGLGPTADDRTMEAIAHVAGVPLVLSPAAHAMVRERVRAVRRQRMSEDEFERVQAKQAHLPDGATVLPPVGTAPGCVLTVAETVIVVLPGPPNELIPMWTDAVGSGVLAERLADVAAGDERMMRLWWVSEAELMAAFGDLDAASVARIGTYTRHGELEIAVPADLGPGVEEVLRRHFGSALFALGGEEVDQIVATALRADGATLAVAESCTGGALGARIVARAGASDWFAGGVISYSNDVKVRALGVDPAAIATDGAVSERVAVQMADGARTATGADWGVSITGVAGPGGGTDDKPVGTVWIGVAGPEGTDAERFTFPATSRDVIQRRAVTAALHRLRIRLER